MAQNEHAPPPPPIAIIGIGLRLPGGVTTPDEFWDLLINKRDGKCKVPTDRYNVDAFYDQGLGRQRVATDQGYFLDENLKAFDASFFSAKRQEAEVVDPQQRLLLEVVWECLESAGQTSLRGTETGVYVGVFGEDWHDTMHKDTEGSSAYRVLSASDFALANRISHDFDFRGPSMTVRTACSAFLTGLHLACQALRNGDCSAALVAGSSIIMSPDMTLDMSQQGVLSPTGTCKTFDAAADGFARGEAINAILIKPLEDALRCNDPIRAIIRGTAVNSDGKTSNMGCPSTEAQERMIRQAYKLAGIKDVSQTPFVECHGTGTAVGDPLEAAAVANVFGERGAFIGSVKPNVGHGEGASAITSVIKAVLALEHRVIPPSIHFTTPNPKIPFEKGKLQVPIDAIPWPKDREARVSVNSFGIGGANAHVIIDAPSNIGSSLASNTSTTITIKDNDKPGFRILPISAANSKSLKQNVENIEAYVTAGREPMDKVAHTLGMHRVHLPHRTFCVVKSDDSSPPQFTDITNFRASKTASVIFIFTGQGAQWAGMGKNLIHCCSSFRHDIQEMDKVLQTLQEAPEWSLEELLCSDHNPDAIAKAEFAQPVSTALQIALVNMFRRYGISPSGVIGHSSGEIAAAYAAGALLMKEAIVAAYFRGLIMKHHTRSGAMAAIGMGSEAVSRYLTDGVEIACENSPSSVTISGDIDAVTEVEHKIGENEPDVFVRRLRVEKAYHSAHMREIGDKYVALLEPYLESRPCNVPFYSTARGQKISTSLSLDAAYWRENLECPVRFNQAVKALLSEGKGTNILLEIGPHATLHGPIRQIFQKNGSKEPPRYVSALIRGENSYEYVLKAAGQLFVYGCPVDFAAINPAAAIATNLPNYAWDHGTEYWKESRVSKAWKFRKNLNHELLGSRCLESSDSDVAWRNILHVHDVPWLVDHRVMNNIIFPCTGYIAMIGEAVRQVQNAEAYEVRNLTIKTALVLPETDSIELMTAMRPSRLTQLTNSSWYDFTISSFNGKFWIEHCIAQGRALKDDAVSPTTRSIKSLVRHCQSEIFYIQMQNLGLKYGPSFRGLKDITVHTDDAIAAATFQNDIGGDGEIYAVHPATMDLCLQLHGISAYQGLMRKAECLQLPVEVKYAAVRPCGREPLRAECTAQQSTSGALTDQVWVTTAEDKVILRLDSKYVPFVADDASVKETLLHAARLVWRPDINFLPTQTLLARGKKRDAMIGLETCTAMCILRFLHNTSGLEVNTQSYCTKFMNWLQSQRDGMLSGAWKQAVPAAARWATLDLAFVDAELRKLLEAADSEDDEDIRQVMQLLCNTSEAEVARAIHAGETNAVDCDPEKGMSSLDRIFSDSINANQFFNLLCHSEPTLRVLEVGGKTGNLTEGVLQAMMSPEGVAMYSEYVFTDSSPKSLPTAQKKLGHWRGVKCQTLNIEASTGDQGFELGYFDLIIANNILQTTTSVSKALRNMRSLLRAGGRLYVRDHADTFSWRTANFIRGLVANSSLRVDTTESWPDTPYLSLDKWDIELRAAGFCGNEAAMLDDEPYWHVNMSIISKAVEAVQSPHSVTLLYRRVKSPLANQLAAKLEKGGTAVLWADICGKEPIPRQDIISTIELENPFFHNISKEEYDGFIQFLSRIKSGVLWLTRQVQIGSADPRFGMITGLARTIRVELALAFWTVELQDLDDSVIEQVLAIFEKFIHRPPPGMTVDSEYSIQNGVTYTSRYHWTNLSAELQSQVHVDDAKSLQIGQYGMMDSLQFLQHQAGIVQSHEVEVQIRSTGLNFRDVMIAMGIVEDGKDVLGLEASGIVTSVSSAVHHVKCGDRVITTCSGLFSTKKVVPGRFVARIPDGISFEEAATLPVVYMTVLHAFFNVACLRKGQSLLIHSACGGVGQAAINVAKMVGAEIYTTVGNDDKVKYLVDVHDIPRTRIFNSRNTSFVDDVMSATAGKGVDVVLNSLSGDLLHASWQCVAKYGKMLEIGKRDILERGQLALNPFQGNRTFHGIDLEGLYLDRPDDIQRLITQFIELYDSGSLKPIRPIHTFPALQMADAFRFMKKGQHIGKIVVNMPEDISQINATPVAQLTRFSDTSTYLMIGGFGGIGRAITRWMIECGAKNFVFLSRSASSSSSSAHSVFIREIESQGCHVVAVAGSVAEASDVTRAVAAAKTPIVGVLQMSMELRDRRILDISYEDWQASTSPKVAGTWNIHNALLNADLNFFVLFGSISGAVGHPGHGLGLACSILDIGAVEDVGYLADKPAKLKQYRAAGVYLVQERQIIQALQVSIRNSRPGATSNTTAKRMSFDGLQNKANLAIGLRSTKSISDLSNRSLIKQDIRLGLYNQLEAITEVDSDSQDDGLRDLLLTIEGNPEILHQPATLDQISVEIGRMLFSFMLLPEKDLDTSMALTAIGVDSLVSIEIRNWWRRSLGLQITPLEVMNAGTIEGLGKLAIASLQEKHGPKPGEMDISTGDSLDAQ